MPIFLPTLIWREQANGGILFLDEVHRLPPEGQEALFIFLDTGSFPSLVELFPCSDKFLM